MELGTLLSLGKGGLSVISGAQKLFMNMIGQKDKERERLKLRVEESPPSGLLLIIRYFPQFEHIGIRARVTLMQPEKAILHAGKFVSNPLPMANGTYFRPQLNGACLQNVGLVQLADIYGDDSLVGVFYILPSADLSSLNDRVEKARVKVEILTDAGKRLLKEEYPVSPRSPVSALRMVQ